MEASHVTIRIEKLGFKIQVSCIVMYKDVGLSRSVFHSARISFSTSEMFTPVCEAGKCCEVRG